MNSDRFGQTKLSDAEGHNWAPTRSPDGKKTAFNSDRPGSDGTTDLDIWRMRAADGASPTNLTDNAVLDFDPEWQPPPPAPLSAEPSLLPRPT